VELAAVVVLPAEEDVTPINPCECHVVLPSKTFRASCFSRLPILGNDLLHSWMRCVRKLGMQTLWLTSSDPREKTAWSPLAKLARQGIERLLMIKLKSYAEMDLADLVRFHCESRNSVTEAHDTQGRLGVCLLNQLALQKAGREIESNIASEEREQTPYSFRGYAKRILSAKERQELIGDALTGACAMRPLGTEVREQVWVGEGAILADSVRFAGPVYIGAHTVVRDGVTVGPFASVERDCIVDCGTAVERSTILPNTYLAPGLRIQNALVDGGCLEDLSSGTIADLQPAGLAGRARHRSVRSAMFSKKVDVSPSQPYDGSTWVSPHSSGQSDTWRQVQL
jgi:hypothetical protein